MAIVVDAARPLLNTPGPYATADGFSGTARGADFTRGWVINASVAEPTIPTLRTDGDNTPPTMPMAADAPVVDYTNFHF